ncbi:MAG: TolC family protein [Spirochaetales bacterium]|nr:MAG: TolC family protein [Spirochaetales bacterium]
MNKGFILACCCLAGYGAFAQTLPLDAQAQDYALVVDRFKGLTSLTTAYHTCLDRLHELSEFSAVTERDAVAGGQGLKAPYGFTDLLFIMERGSPAASLAEATVRAASGDLAGARAAWLPILRGEINGAYLGNPQEAISIPAMDVTIFPAVDPTQYSFKLIGEQPLFTWGKIAAGVRSAEAGLRAARLAQAKTEHENTIRLQASYEALCYIVEAEAAVAVQKSAGERLATLAEQNLESGFLTSSEFLSVRIKVKEIEIGLAALVERRERLLSELGAMTGLRDLRLEQIDLAAPIAGLPNQSGDRAADTIIKSSYDLALADAMVDLKSEMHRLAHVQARSLPDIGLSVELSYAGSRFPFLENNWSDAGDYQLIIGLGASGRLLGDAVKAGALARAKAELDQAMAQRDDAERRIRSFIRESYLAIDLAKTRIEYALLKQESWLASLAQQETTLSLGGGSETEYLTLLIETLGGLADAYGTLANYRSTLLSLEAAAGDMADR